MALTSNIMKVGAHVDDTRVLLRVWDDALDTDDNVSRIIDQNLLGLPSQSRARDVIVRALRPRFFADGPGRIPALRHLSTDADAFRDACYFELTRVDALVTAFVEEQIPRWWSEGRLAINTSDAREWIDKLIADGRAVDWSENIRNRVARGMMAALRDLGRLTGPASSPRKELVQPGISTPGFAYVAARVRDEAVSSRGLVFSSVWKRWMLDPALVDTMLDRLAARGILYYSTAGSSLRVDWRLHSLEEVVRAAI